MKYQKLLPKYYILFNRVLLLDEPNSAKKRQNRRSRKRQKTRKTFKAPSDDEGSTTFGFDSSTIDESLAREDQSPEKPGPSRGGFRGRGRSDFRGGLRGRGRGDFRGGRGRGDFRGDRGRGFRGRGRGGFWQDGQLDPRANWSNSKEAIDWDAPENIA